MKMKVVVASKTVVTLAALALLAAQIFCPEMVPFTAR
jgi:hypothetical protein